MVFSDNAAPFGDLQKFKDQNVEISGNITEYRNKPKIILENSGQCKVLDGK
jgi:DNA/RNA endonuclease YhcR with UshA esterase domain